MSPIGPYQGRQLHPTFLHTAANKIRKSSCLSQCTLFVLSDYNQGGYQHNQQQNQQGWQGYPYQQYGQQQQNPYGQAQNNYGQPQQQGVSYITVSLLSSSADRGELSGPKYNRMKVQQLKF